MKEETKINMNLSFFLEFCMPAFCFDDIMQGYMT